MGARNSQAYERKDPELKQRSSPQKRVQHEPPCPSTFLGANQAEDGHKQIMSKKIQTEGGIRGVEAIRRFSEENHKGIKKKRSATGDQQKQPIQ